MQNGIPGISYCIYVSLKPMDAMKLYVYGHIPQRMNDESISNCKISKVTEPKKKKKKLHLVNYLINDPPSVGDIGLGFPISRHVQCRDLIKTHADVSLCKLQGLNIVRDLTCSKHYVLSFWFQQTKLVN